MEYSNISIPEDVRAELEAAVNAEGYPGPGELIRDLLRDYQERRRALEAALQEGEDSGFEEYSFEAIMAEARARYQSG